MATEMFVDGRWTGSVSDETFEADSPATGEKISLAALTDSTTAASSPLANFLPTAGSSTKTT